jgi:hypothetical protein
MSSLFPKDPQKTQGQRGVWQPKLSPHKLKSPAVCTQCRVVYQDSRWQWLEKPQPDATKVLCPACELIQNGQSNGHLTISGEFFQTHRDEILALIRHVIENETKQHPLNRLIDLQSDADKTVLTFTDGHHPKRIGHALEQAYDGDFEINYNEDYCEASWRR